MTKYSNNMKAVFGCAISLIGLLCLVVYDSKSHFDIELIKLKKKAHSAQRHWNMFYGQENVYESGGLKHAQDFSALRNIIEPNTAVFSDMATSYYLAASLPLYAKNIHRHHGRYRFAGWSALLDSNVACYLNVPDNLKRFKQHLQTEEQRVRLEGAVPVKYVAINTEQKNINFKRDCLSQTRRSMLSVIDGFAKPVYEGETVLIYKLTTSSSDHD